MENQLDRNAELQEELKRVYRSAALGTGKLLGAHSLPLEEAVHNARKGMRFMVSLLKLVKEPVGERVYDRERALLLGFESDLSHIRDLHVLQVILKHIATEAHSVSQADVAPALQELERRAAIQAEEADESRLFDTIASGLEVSAIRFREAEGIPNEVSGLLPGLRTTYGEGREQAGRSGDALSPELIVSVAELLHQRRLLRPYWPAASDLQDTSLQQLIEYLSEERDLRLFLNLLADEEYAGRLSGIEAMSSYTDQKLAFLRRSAANLANYIYDASPEAFTAPFEPEQDAT